jgi:5-methylcytosine-specific restriction enzyme subunit McrC
MVGLFEASNISKITRQMGTIPIRNIWLLMLYASDLYRLIGTKKVEVEDNPEEIADLVAEILCHHVEKRLMRNLSYGYKSRVNVISRVRGRIDTLTTESQRLLDKGKICCKFDELTIDTPRNRYVRAALERLIKLDIRTSLAYKCRNLAVSLERLGVSKIKPVAYNSKSERFGRHDSDDQKMVAAADLAFSLALPTEFDGLFNLSSPDSKKEWLRKLFEKAIAGFYAVALDKSEWNILSGKQFDWQISSRSSGIGEILPHMKTDIIIDQRKSGLRLVIDTKFNSVTTNGWYREETLRSGYIYQMYTYLRSQENSNDESSLSSIGMLLHPAVNKDVSEVVTIQGHPIWFCTVNLGEAATSIRQRLLLLHETSFDLHSDPPAQGRR